MNVETRRVGGEYRLGVVDRGVNLVQPSPSRTGPGATPSGENSTDGFQEEVLEDFSWIRGSDINTMFLNQALPCQYVCILVDL